jgi:type IV pilus assembly protein PilM
LSALKSLLGRLRGEKITVGLDIGHTGMRAVKVRHGNGLPELLQVVVVPYGTESPVIDGEVRNLEVFRNLVSGLVNELEIDGRWVQLIAGFGKSAMVLTDHREYKIPEGVDEVDSLQSQIQSTGLFGDSDLMTHFQVVHRKDKSLVEVVMVAAKRRLVQAWEKAFDDLPCNLQALDVDCMASYNALSLEDLPEEPTPLAILNIGAQHSYLTFVTKGAYHSTRDLERISLTAFDRILITKNSMSPQAAREKLFNSAAGSETLHGVYKAVEEALNQAIGYYHNQSREKLTHLFVCGGGALVPGLVDTLKRIHTWTDVRLMSGIGELSRKDDSLLPDPKDWPLLTVATGLALRRK